ncbi:MAG: class I SAM-dependent methyltransferase [Pirellulales bacterium]
MLDRADRVAASEPAAEEVSGVAAKAQIDRPAAATQLPHAAEDATAAEADVDPSAAPPAAFPTHYVYAPSRDPNGIGKFFLGREIAHFMTYHGAGWLERPERQQTEQPDRLLDAMQISPGATVADIGAGSGYFSLRLARRVGPEGRVLAVDIQKEMLALLAQNQKNAGLDNIVGILGTASDPKLPAREVDLVLMVDAYHEFAYPMEMLRHIRRSLKRDGRVVFVEYRKEDPSINIKLLHKMTEAQVRREAEAMGLQWLETLDFLPTQHVVIFAPCDARAGI